MNEDPILPKYTPLIRSCSPWLVCEVPFSLLSASSVPFARKLEFQRQALAQGPLPPTGASSESSGLGYLIGPNRLLRELTMYYSPQHLKYLQNEVPGFQKTSDLRSSRKAREYEALG